MSDVIIYQGAAIPFSFSRQNGQPLDVTSVMRTLADITTYAANTEKKYVPYEGQTIACLEDKMLYILELKNGVLVPKLSGGVKLIKRDDNVELTDDAALSALRSVKEIEDRAISRLKRDTAAEPIEFKKGLTAAGGKTTVSGDGKITTLNLLVQALAETYDLNVSHVATMMRTIIKDYVSSEAFTPGLLGEGFKISKALNGDWNLEVDNIVVRKVMTIFELVISKVRSVNGGLVISPANGRVKSVAETTGSPVYYVIGIEGDMQFVVDDYVRCQVFNGGQAKYYWVRVSSISNNSILVLKSEFTNGAVPAVGDDLVQMGNKTNKARQGLIYLTASEDGKPRISVMDGVNSTSTVGKNKVILGCLDGITDTDFPADFQPSGYGLYAMNVFLKGIFVLRSGKTVESELTTTNAAVTAAKQIADAAKELANSANALLSDIASDNKLTPSEKQATKKEWEQIVSEKVKNDASADKYGVSKVACTTAYNALSVYITPLLASLITTSDIVGSDFRAKFKAYYDARADLLNSISAKAKELADAAQGKATEAANAAATAQAKADQANTVAGAAQSTADGAVANAATANSLLSDIANDNKFTATEKQQTKKEWDVIVSEKPLNNASAVKFYVSTAAYDTAYNALNTYITPLLASLSTTSNIVGSTFRSTFKAYYDARTNLLNAVSEKAKRLADDAQNAANAAQAKADTVDASFQQFIVAGGQLSSIISETKTYADNKANAAKDAANIYADGKVNGLQFGGRNLLEKSHLEKTGRNEYLSYSDTTSCFDKYGVGQYVISFDLKLSNAGSCIFYSSGPASELKYMFSKNYTIQATTDYVRYSYVVDVVIGNPDKTASVIAFYTTFGTGLIPTVRNVKIERGNKPTDWTSAPEDVTADAQAKASAAQAAAEAVAIAQATLAKTEASAYADGIVTAEEQRAIADAQAKLAEAKADAQAKANDAKQAAINDAANKYPTKSEVTSSINQKADEINLSVAGKISGIQVGGRNYYQESTQLSITNCIANKIQSLNGLYLVGPESGYSLVRLSGVITSNGIWTISFDVRGSQGVQPGFFMDICDAGRVRVLATADNRFVHHEVTVEVKNWSDDVYNFVDIDNISWAYIYVRNLKIEKGNKATDWTPAPEDVQSQITENKSQIQVLSDQIALKVSNDTFNALGNRVSAAEATLTVQANQIASKVSQNDFNTLGQRVGSAESAILQQADQISLKASKSDLNTLSGRVSSTEAELRVHATEIGMKVTAGDVSAGMTITPNKISLFAKDFSLTGMFTFESMASDAQGKITAAQSTADKAITDAANSLVTSRNNIAVQLGYGSYDAMSAAAIAGKTIINGGKIRTELLDATAIVTGALVASVISATNITTGKLTVTDGAVIGGFSVIKEGLNYSLINNNLTAKIVIQSGNDKYLRIGGRENTLISMRIDGANDGLANNGIFIQSYGSGNKCIELIANAGSEYAIKSHGPHLFGQRNGEKWNAPGVLWCGQYSCSNWNPALVRSWGDGLGLDASGRRMIPTISRSKSGCYTITHNLGHVDYFVHAIGNAQIRDNWNWWNTTVSFFNHSANYFSLQFKDDGGGEKDPAEFQVMIFGRNKF